eukprot:g81871.t1
MCTGTDGTQRADMAAKYGAAPSDASEALLGNHSDMAYPKIQTDGPMDAAPLTGTAAQTSGEHGQDGETALTTSATDKGGCIHCDHCREAARTVAFAQPDDAQPRKRRRNYSSYPRRWWILFVFSALSIMSHVLTYTFSPIHTRSSYYYSASEVQMSLFADCFFISYLLLAIPTSVLVDRKGLRFAVVSGAWIQTLGAFLRYAWPLLFPVLTAQDRYRLALSGQMICSIPEAIFGNAPPMIAAVWFPASERALATAIACSSGLAGIALAYILSPMLAREEDGSDIPHLLELYTYMCFGLAMLATLYFPERPPCPPSYTAELKLRVWLENQSAKLKAEFDAAMQRVGAVEKVFTHVKSSVPLSQKALQRVRMILPFSGAGRDKLGGSVIASVRAELLVLCSFFKERGFTQCAIGLAMSEAVGNVYAVAMNSQLVPLGFDLNFVTTMAIAMILSLVFGSVVVGAIAERLGVKWFKSMAVLCSICLAATQLGFTFLAMQETGNKYLIGLSIALIGFFAGPLQPLSIELAAECTFPSSETAFSSVMLIGANVTSAALVPIIFFLRDINKKSDRLTMGNFLLFGLCVGMMFALLSFNGELRRTMRDMGSTDDMLRAQSMRRTPRKSGGSLAFIPASESTIIWKHPGQRWQQSYSDDSGSDDDQDFFSRDANERQALMQDPNVIEESSVSVQ